MVTSLLIYHKYLEIRASSLEYLGTDIKLTQLSKFYLLNHCVDESDYFLISRLKSFEARTIWTQMGVTFKQVLSCVFLFMINAPQSPAPLPKLRLTWVWMLKFSQLYGIPLGTEALRCFCGVDVEYYCFDMDPSTEPTRSPISTNQTREMLLFLAQFFGSHAGITNNGSAHTDSVWFCCFWFNRPTVKWLYGCLQCNQLITISSSNLRIKLRHHWQNLGCVLFSFSSSFTLLSFFLCIALSLGSNTLISSKKTRKLSVHALIVV